MQPTLITVEHPARCLTCESLVAFGQPAWWVQDVGIWHKDCKEPRNWRVYAAEAAQRRKLGL